MLDTIREFSEMTIGSLVYFGGGLVLAWLWMREQVKKGKENAESKESKENAESDSGSLRVKNDALRAENLKLQGENLKLQGEIQRLRTDLHDSDVGGY